MQLFSEGVNYFLQDINRILIQWTCATILCSVLMRYYRGEER